MTQPFVPDASAALVRYLVTDLDRAVSFYTELLAFKLVQRAGPVAIISRGSLNLLLSSPDSSGARPMPDGTRQAPGGWNRIVLYVDDLDALISTLAKAKTHFRNAVEGGPGGRQIQLDDPDGNPIELHEPPKK